MSKKTLISGICYLASVLALTAPGHAAPQDELARTRQEIEQAQKRQAELEEETKSLQAEMKQLQNKLVTLAAALQKNEAEQADAEDKLRILNEQLKAKDEALKTRRRHLAMLVQAALSLSRTPPEAMLMMPGDPSRIMIAARALSLTSTGIREETVSLGLQLAELSALKDKVAQRKSELAVLQTALDQQRSDLKESLTERAALQARLGQEQKQEAGKLARLARKASDLQDLVARVEKENEERAAEEQIRKARTPPEHLRSVAAAQGRLHAPASGKLVQAFGSNQGRNNTAKGIVIRTRNNAQIVAPFDGEVIFTGPFLGYGQMVIIRHSDDFHTLLAGLAKIDVRTGQFLLEGEPIGAMGNSGDPGRKPNDKNENRLYLELRRNNQPVDPARWIGGFNVKS